MSRNSRRPKSQKHSGIPVTLDDGTTTRIKDVPDSAWRRHSGTAHDGRIAKSLGSYKVLGSQSTLISNGSVELRATNAELEVFSVDFLTDLGFTVTAPAAANTA